jgi:putative DNA primase/helicase
MTRTLAACPDATSLAAAIAHLCEQPTHRGDQWQACCPVHEDSHPSLSIGVGEHYDRVVVHCHAGCDPEAILHALGLTWDDVFLRGDVQTNGHKHIVKVYDYYDTHGTLVHQTVRYEPKAFHQRRPDPANPGDYIWKNALQGIEPVLYNLPAILQAIQDNQPIYLVEGEKDADTLIALDVVATTNPMGVGKWRDSYTAALHGAHMVLLPDNDQAGKAHMTKVAARLHGKAASLKLVELPALPPKGDISDWLHSGSTYEDLMAVVSQTPPWTPASEAPEAPQTRPEPALPYSDYTNALALVRDHGENLRYCYPWQCWLVWTGTHWQRDTSGAVMRLAKATIKKLARHIEDLDDPHAKVLMAHIKSSLSTAKLKAMVESAQSEPGIAVQPAELDTNVWLLNVSNGTLDLQTGTLRPHQQADLLTKCLSIPYTTDATCPTWDTFLWRIMGGSPGEDSPDMRVGELEKRQKADERARALIAYLQRAAGYTLTGSTREQCLFLCHGPTKTGKSTYLATLRTLLGSYGKQTDMQTFMHKDRPEVRNDLADLAGARYVYAVESQEGKRLAEGLVKQITGGVDGLKARFLYEEFFEFQPQFKAYIGTNHLPTIKDTDDAIWERIRRIPFTVQIPKEERVKTLDETLRTELPGILRWAVRGCLEWQQLNDLHEPTQVLEATQAYREEMDIVARFLDECCHLNAKFQIKAGDLYTAFKTWCEGTGVRAITLKEFGKRLDDKKIEKHTSNFVWRLGLALKD